ncbi:hypothetical protein [Streptomyces caatingaensis]|uniref:Lon proteolytic domain-containing protein n=1 Tax=Streptomyces caatingaensis TaxID=1678637 RepID=A0A0K9X831_9ACTN|nr:hypothetical protein [Streptomyces caatingaensis]KNB49353.1 hypothetical protein AC230_29255 [Streptomyces caatingaensis]
MRFPPPSAWSPRARISAVCALPVLALLGTAAFAPLPFSIARPGSTVNVLGDHQGKPVISVSGAETRRTSGQLRMSSIIATGPRADVGLADVASDWFRTDRAVMPRDSVFPPGKSDKETEEHNIAEMTKSQDSATRAALAYLHRSPKDVKVTLRLADIGGPSAGLMFALGIVDKLDGDGRGGDLTGGRTIGGTGTIEPDGTVGPVGGVPLKVQAEGRDGAAVFLVPKAQCEEAKGEAPEGMRLIPVVGLRDAVASLKALSSGGRVPAC